MKLLNVKTLFYKVRAMAKLNFRVNWTNNSIKYSLKEKNIVLNAMENAVHLRKDYI